MPAGFHRPSRIRPTPAGPVFSGDALIETRNAATNIFMIF
jgi:hypothetical protein